MTVWVTTYKRTNMANKKNKIIKDAMIDCLLEKGCISHPDGASPVVTIGLNDLWGILAPLIGEACRRKKECSYRKGWEEAFNTYASS